MIVRIRDEAEADLEAAFDWYESRVPGLGQGFLDEFVAAVRAGDTDCTGFRSRWHTELRLITA
jgi:hypothetical protein